MMLKKHKEIKEWLRLIRDNLMINSILVKNSILKEAIEILLLIIWGFIKLIFNLETKILQETFHYLNML